MWVQRTHALLVGNAANSKLNVFSELKQRCKLLVQHFDVIGNEHKEIFENLAV